jgi:hypothetical protein
MGLLVHVVIAESTSGAASAFVRDQNVYDQTSNAANSKGVARDADYERASKRGMIYEFPQKVMQELAGDPIALTCSALLFAYAVGQVLFGAKKSPPVMERKKERKSPKKQSQPSGKSSLAVSLNLSLTKIETVEELLSFASANKESLDIVNVVTTIHRSTKLALSANGFKSVSELAADARLKALVEQLITCFDKDLPAPVLTRAVGNSAWALAKLHYGEPKILEVLEANFSLYAEHFKPEELMNTVWAFADLSRTSPVAEKHATKIARSVARCANNDITFTLQQTVYFAWALARLYDISAVRSDAKVQPGFARFKDLIVDHAQPGVQDLTTKNLAMICWAMAHLQKVKSKRDVSSLLQRVGSDAMSRGLGKFLPGELSSIVWALNKCQTQYPEFMIAFKTYAMQKKMSGFSSQDLANILCAFVNQGEDDDEFYKALSAAISANASSFNKLEKTMVHWGFSQIPNVASPI